MSTTATSPRARQQRRPDLAGVALLTVGIVCGLVSYFLITEEGFNPLLLVPSIVAATTGASHLTKLEAVRDLPPRG